MVFYYSRQILLLYRAYFKIYLFEKLKGLATTNLEYFLSKILAVLIVNLVKKKKVIDIGNETVSCKLNHYLHLIFNKMFNFYYYNFTVFFFFFFVKNNNSSVMWYLEKSHTYEIIMLVKVKLL